MLTWMTLSAFVFAALFALVLRLRWFKRRARSGVKRTNVRLEGLEELQPRIAPAVFTWQGGLANNDWNTPANWGPNNTVLPGPMDTVVFNGTSGASAMLPVSGSTKIGTLQIANGWQGTVSLNGGELDVSSLVDFEDASGTIDGRGPTSQGVLRVANTVQTPASFKWTDGALNDLQLYLGQGMGNKPTAILSWTGGTASDSNLSFLSDSQVTASAGTNIVLARCYLYNAGVFTLSRKIGFDGGQEFNVGEFDMKAGALTTVPVPAAIAYFNNGGTLTTVQPMPQPAPGAEIGSTIEINYDNVGTTESQPGTILRLRRGGVHTGKFIAAPGSILAFDMGDAVKAGAWNILRATCSLQGSGLYDVDDAASVLIDAKANIQVQNFRLEQNSNPGQGKFSVLLVDGMFDAHLFEWRSGTIQHDPNASPQGTVVVGLGETLTMDDPASTTGVFDRVLDGVEIKNQGSIIWKYASKGPGLPLTAPGDLNMMNKAVITNDGTYGQGVFTLATDNSIVQDPNDPKGNPLPEIHIIAKGVMQNIGSPGGAGATIAVPVKNNGGVFKVFPGIPVKVTASYIQTDGNAEVDQGGTLHSTGAFEQDGGSVTDYGTITLAGDYPENAGTVVLQSGTIIANNVNVASGALFSGYGTVTANVNNAGEFDADNGTLAVSGAYTQTAGATNLGRYSNRGPVALTTGRFQDQAGTISLADANQQGVASTLAVSGDVTISSSAGPLSIATGDFFTVTGAVYQSGSLVDVSGGSLTVTGNYNENGGRVTIEAGTLGAGQLLIASGAVLSGYGAANTGVINGGEVDATGGALAVSGAYTQTGTTNDYAGLSVGGGLDQQAGSLSLLGGGLYVKGGYTIESQAILTGGGSVTANLVNAGTIIVGGLDSIGSINIFSDSSAGIAGNYTQTSTGVLNIEIAGSSSYDGFSAAGNAALGGTLNVTLLNGFTPSVGDNYFVMHGVSTSQFAAINAPTENSGHFQAVYNQFGMAFLLQFVSN